MMIVVVDDDDDNDDDGDDGDDDGGDGDDDDDLERVRCSPRACSSYARSSRAEQPENRGHCNVAYFVLLSPLWRVR